MPTVRPKIVSAAYPGKGGVRELSGVSRHRRRGVIGLAIARALARAGREVVVVEAENAIGAGISSRNSEVIHAGIYYPTGLTKTHLCVEGRYMLILLLPRI